jgi:hypothetical protein
MKPITKFGVLLATIPLTLSYTAQVVQALTFNFTPATGMSQTAISGFTAAGSRWSSRLYDPVTVNLAINFTPMGSGILGGADPALLSTNYATIKTLLAQDQTSTLDGNAVGNLPGGNAVPLYVNRLANSPSGSGSAIPYVDNDGDANNTRINFTSANLKALGLASFFSSSFIDASITFNSNYAFDFDPSDGIGAGTFDFVGIATHEIGHALGFVSGVDFLDTQTPPVPDDQFPAVFVMDLFRYSTASKANGALDWTADNRGKYFSVDGGNTAIASFATGVNFGDGRQASHWKDNLGIGIMDPTTAPGEVLQITPTDLLLFDAIGWNTQPVSVPAPAPTLGLWVLTGWSGLQLSRRKYLRRKLSQP